MADFVYLYRNAQPNRDAAMATPEQRQKVMERWMSWFRDLEAKGHIKSMGQPLDPTGKVVRGNAKTITDGPFVEAKDIIGGFSIVVANDAAHAAELAKGCPALDMGGSVEVRPVMQMNI
ncbi:MAG TPA: YciI family protein [Gemmatimonadaceae bacterium]|nr:YciI family protein [Gemmatimonadaceae bacterium]